MGYLNNLDPGLRAVMESRKLSLHEFEGIDDFLVYWDDGADYGLPDDKGLPVGRLTVYVHRGGGLMRRPVERWEAWVDNDIPGADKTVVCRMAPDINEAIRAVLLHLPRRFS